MKKNLLLLLLFVSIISCKKDEYDVIIRQGTIYDGLGSAPVVADLGIRADTVAFIGDLSKAVAKKDIDAKGMAVAPGFINMLSWAVETLILDGNSQSDIRQGVTLEVFGEGGSMGPINEEMREGMLDDMRRSPDYTYDIDWTTLDEYLRSLEKRGIAPNVASFIGATSVRIHELKYENRLPNEEELSRMQDLVRKAMEDGALGVGSSLIYAPANYSSTEELIAL
ncbi:MAG: D-aminoacylase, partial [Cyclobacteriaceae bacterium]